MKTALITGGNRGIGLEFAKQLQHKGYQPIVTCRQTSEALDELNCQVITDFDVSSSHSVNHLAQKLAGKKLDLIINNAGILESMSLDDLDFDAIRRQFEVNTLGPLRLTKKLLPNLSKGSKVVIITSRMGSIADGSGGQYGYRISKTGVNMVGSCLSHDLKSQGIAVALLHPGYVRTGMTGNQGLINTDESVNGLIMRIEELNMENTGGFWHTDGSKLPW